MHPWNLNTKSTDWPEELNPGSSDRPSRSVRTVSQSPEPQGRWNRCLLCTRIKPLQMFTDDDGDVYCGRVWRCRHLRLGLAYYTLLRLKVKNAWHFMTAILVFALHWLGHLVLSYLIITWKGLMAFYMVIACLCCKRVNTRIAFWGLKQQYLATFVPVKNWHICHFWI